MSLEVDHGKNIGHHKVRLLKDMDPILVLPYFIQEGNLTSHEIEEVKGGTTRKDKCEILLDLITRSGVDTYYVLVNALVQVKPHLACLLLQSENEELRDKLAGANWEVKKLRTELRAERLGRSVQANNNNEAGTAENATPTEQHDNGEKDVKMATLLNAEYADLTKRVSHLQHLIVDTRIELKETLNLRVKFKGEIEMLQSTAHELMDATTKLHRQISSTKN